MICLSLYKALALSSTKQLHTSSVYYKGAAFRGHWYSGEKRKGQVSRPKRDVVDGRLIGKFEKLRFSYLGKEKYEYDKPDVASTHYGQFTRTMGDPLVWNEELGYRVTVEDPGRVFRRDQNQLEKQISKFGEVETKKLIHVHNPYPCSFVSPLVWRFIEKLKLTRYGGVHNAFDIMAVVFQQIKLSQMALKKKNPDKNVELDCNKILEQAVENVSPVLKIDFVQVIKKQDGYKPCPVPLSRSQSTNLAIKRLKIAAKPRRKMAVKPRSLAKHILAAYNKKGVVYQQLQEDLKLGYKFRDLYSKYGRVAVTKLERKRRTIYQDQTHLKEVLDVTLPLENADYGHPPGQLMWYNDQLIDEEDKR